MRLNGTSDLVSFLDHLRSISRSPWFHVRQIRDDRVTVVITMPGMRLDVDFRELGVEYRLFEGDESVSGDEEGLVAAIGRDGAKEHDLRPGSIAVGGLAGLLALLELLSLRTSYRWLDQHRDETVMLTIAAKRCRIEVEFFEDHIEYSIFEGDDVLHGDQERLFALIEERGK